ncbi:MAG: Mov34/MPN/PAD-1 family protein [Cephaloticoccus sp.]|nr:Mov34/MPN/PAD-1 family protein [Cephaloticoccus sp.]
MPSVPKPPGDFQISTDRVGQTLVFTRETIATLLNHQQLKPTEPEGGGMLFAHIEPGWITIRVATLPQQADHRSWVTFEPNLKLQQREIRHQFKRGLHFIGEWHTHPELRPQPSGTDLQSMARCFATSKHSLHSFVMVIIGTAKWPYCLWVSLHRENSITRLYPTKGAHRNHWLGVGWFESLLIKKKNSRKSNS